MRTLEGLQTEYEVMSEQLGDIISQHRAEVALAGDSWPGAQIQIGEMTRYVSKLEGEIAAAKAERAGAELEVKYATCSKLYRYTGMPHWSHTPKLAALAWERDHRESIDIDF